MLYFIAVWMGLILICSIIGTGMLHWLAATRFDRQSDRQIVAVWLGLIGLAVALLATSLVVPLSPFVGVDVAITLGVAALLSPASRREVANHWAELNWQSVGIGLAFAIAAAAITTHPVDWIDTGLYHYSAIQWLSRFGTVPGLALLFSNLGFTSSWFALAAPLNPVGLDARATPITNGLILLLIFLQSLICLIRCWQPQARPSDWFMVAFFGLLLPLMFVSGLLSGILVSPSPDVPVAVLTGVVAWAILVVTNGVPQPEPNTSQRDLSHAVPLLLAAGAVTIKLIAIPLFLTSVLFYVGWSKLNGRSLLLGGAIVALILAPMLLASITTSGCPLYPSSLFCLNLPWSPSPEVAQAAANQTHGWTNWYTNPPAGANRWLWLLWKWLTDAKENLAMALTLGLLLVICGFSIQPIRNSKIRGLGWVGAIAAVGITFLMLTSPFFRFAIPYLLVIPALLITVYCQLYARSLQLLLQRVTGQWFHQSWYLFASCFLATLALVTFAGNQMMTRLILPPPLRRVAVIEKQVNDLPYNSPQDPEELCWATEIPCAFTVPSGVRLRSPAQGLKAGFVHD